MQMRSQSILSLAFVAVLFVSPVSSGFLRAPKASDAEPVPIEIVADSEAVAKQSSSCVDSNESLTCDLLVGEDKSICSKQLASGARLQDLCPTHCNCCNVAGQCTCNDDTTVESIAQSYGVYYVHSCADALQHVQCNDTRFAKRLRQYCPCFCLDQIDIETPCFDLNMIDYANDGWNGTVLTVTSCDGETTFVSTTLESGGDATEVYCFTPPEEGLVVTVSSGDSPSDVMWSISDAGSDDPFLGGGAPSRFSFCNESPAPTPNCYAVYMSDSFGDGWNGANLDFVSCDGATIASVTLPGGSSGSQTVCLDSSIEFFGLMVSAGGYPSEVSWHIEGPNSADTFQNGGAPYYNSNCPSR